MSLYVYCRVSTERQSLKRQMDNILAARGGASLPFPTSLLP